MTINAALSAEIQKLAPSAKVVLFEVDLTVQGGEIYRFHAGTNGLTQNVVWQGETYTPWAVQASGFDFSSSGQLPRPKLALANVQGAITALVLAYGDCRGAKVTRRATMAKFLDAVNFPGGTNPIADPDAGFPDEIYFIDRKAKESPKKVVEFELAGPWDVTGVKLPRRQIIRSVCPFQYRGAECGYAGTNYFDANDLPVATAGEDVCSQRLSGCKCRFGENNELPFGGFPGVGVIA